MGSDQGCSRQPCLLAEPRDRRLKLPLCNRFELKVFLSQNTKFLDTEFALSGAAILAGRIGRWLVPIYCSEQAATN